MTGFRGAQYQGVRRLVLSTYRQGKLWARSNEHDACGRRLLVAGCVDRLDGIAEALDVVTVTSIDKHLVALAERAARRLRALPI